MTENDLKAIREGVNLKWKFWLRPWKLRRDMNALCDALEKAWQSETKALENLRTTQEELLKAGKGLTALTQWVHATHRLSLPSSGPLKQLFGSFRRKK